MTSYRVTMIVKMGNCHRELAVCVLYRGAVTLLGLGLVNSVVVHHMKMFIVNVTLQIHKKDTCQFDLHDFVYNRDTQQGSSETY